MKPQKSKIKAMNIIYSLEINIKMRYQNIIKKPNATIGRPPKTKLEEKIDEEPETRLNDIIVNINNLIIELKQKIKKVQ